MESSLNFYSLLIIGALAFLIPLMVNEIKKVKIPVVIAEIAAGIIVGKSGFCTGMDFCNQFFSL